jgi:hypothetical protein
VGEILFLHFGNIPHLRCLFTTSFLIITRQIFRRQAILRLTLSR